MRKGRLENWQEISWCGHIRIAGYIHGMTGEHSDEFKEGSMMTTNRVAKRHTFMGQTVVETDSGSLYELGVPADISKTAQDVIKEMMSQVDAN